MSKEGGHFWYQGAFVVFVTLFTGSLRIGAVCLGGLAIYHFWRMVTRILRYGPSHKWFRFARLLVIALVLSAISSIAILVVTADPVPPGGYSDPQGKDMDFAINVVKFTGIGFPVWCVALLLLGLPLRIVKWIWVLQDRRKGLYARGEAAKADAERRRLDEARRETDAETARSQTHEQRRRTESRARCELAYGRFGLRIRERFPRSEFDAFIQKYMGDDQPSEDVERRAEELIELMRQHLDDVEPPEKKKSLDELARWFIEQKEQIDALPLDPKVKRAHVAELTGRYAELSSKLLEELQP